MRSIFVAVGLFALGSMVGCADVLGTEPWEDKPLGANSSGGGSPTTDSTGQGATGSGSMDSCQNGVQDLTETGVDCGGSACETCPDARGCLVDSDCGSGFCPVSRGYCVTDDGRATCGVEEMDNATCGDCIKNAVETDIDCGGDCLPCRTSKACTLDADCWSNSCKNGVCAAGMATTRCFSNADCSNGACTAAASMSGCDFESCCL